jgi:hypothetical protein
VKFLGDSGDKAYRKVKKRLGTVSNGQTVEWAEGSLWAVQEGLEAYRLHRDHAALQQARLGAVGLLAAVDSLLDRPL